MTRLNEPGVYDGIPMADYLADPCPEPSASAGLLETVVNKTPYHAMCSHPRLGTPQDNDTKATDRGTAVHALALDKADVITWLPFDNFRTKEAQGLRDEARDSGRVPLLEKDRDDIELMARSARDKLVRCFGKGSVEQTAVWNEGGIWCRARYDFLSSSREVAVDLKTATSASPHSFGRQIYAYGYDITYQHYLTGLIAIEGPAPREYVFLVLESEPPYEASLVTLSPAYKNVAFRRRGLGMHLWKKALQSGSWPAYGDHVYEAEPPAYAVWDIESKEVLTGVIE